MQRFNQESDVSNNMPNEADSRQVVVKKTVDGQKRIDFQNNVGNDTAAEGNKKNGNAAPGATAGSKK